MRRLDGEAADDLLAHCDWLRRLVQALVRDGAVADDVVQDTWLAALRRPPSRDRPLRPWLATVARNLVRSRGRANVHRGQREIRASEPAGALPSAEELLAHHEQLRLVAGLVSALDEPYRSTVLLCYAEGLSPVEIARKLGRRG